MYLSRLVLNPTSRAVQQDLSNPYQLHRTVMSGFPPLLTKHERVLYRLEMQRAEPQISVLVQSHDQPNWSRLEDRDYLARPAEVKTFNLNPAAGDVYRFRLLANPTKRLGKNDRAAGSRVGLQREEDQLAWLHRKGEMHGFRLLMVQVAVMNQPDGWKEQEGKVHRIRQVGVRFDGLLEINKPDLFAEAVSKGIGSGKGLGFGLLSLAPAV